MSPRKIHVFAAAFAAATALNTVQARAQSCEIPFELLNSSEVSSWTREIRALASTYQQRFDRNERLREQKRFDEMKSVSQATCDAARDLKRRYNTWAKSKTRSYYYDNFRSTGYYGSAAYQRAYEIEICNRHPGSCVSGSACRSARGAYRTAARDLRSAADNLERYASDLQAVKRKHEAICQEKDQQRVKAEEERKAKEAAKGGAAASTSSGDGAGSSGAGGSSTAGSGQRSCSAADVGNVQPNTDRIQCADCSVHDLRVTTAQNGKLRFNGHDFKELAAAYACGDGSWGDPERMDPAKWGSQKKPAGDNPYGAAGAAGAGGATAASDPYGAQSGGAAGSVQPAPQPQPNPYDQIDAQREEQRRIAQQKRELEKESMRRIEDTANEVFRKNPGAAQATEVMATGVLAAFGAVLLGGAIYYGSPGGQEAVAALNGATALGTGIAFAIDMEGPSTSRQNLIIGDDPWFFGGLAVQSKLGYRGSSVPPEAWLSLDRIESGTLNGVSADVTARIFAARVSLGSAWRTGSFAVEDFDEPERQRGAEAFVGLGVQPFRGGLFSPWAEVRLTGFPNGGPDAPSLTYELEADEVRQARIGLGRGWDNEIAFGNTFYLGGFGLGTTRAVGRNTMETEVILDVSFATGGITGDTVTVALGLERVFAR